ncbi:F0F1 ATP synthase subunit epsilon [Candidatus Kaiserbacteria bacterium]|nr:F0F1 ATP synthase subunit epsilon [Candidatus Kaiserbacteria bacterium]
MADSTFHLVIASVGETRYDGRAHSVTLPGVAGELTMLAHHEPLVTTLKAGEVTVRDSSGEKKFTIEDGVLEYSGNRAVVLL